jgi:hypothetical protein
MIACEIIVLKNGGFDFSRVFLGKETGMSLAPKAEEFFKKTVRSLVNYEVTDDDLEIDIENGYFYDANQDIDVIITWPTIEEVR